MRQAIDDGPIAGEPCKDDDVDAFGACRPVPEGEVDQYGWRPGDPTRNGFRNPYDPLAATQQRGRQERDTTLDYQTADLEKACRRQMARPRVGTLYSWDAWHGKCLYLGSPATYKTRRYKKGRTKRQARVARKSKHPLTDGKYWDLKQDCLRRGSSYSYQYPWRDGEPGQCLKMGEVVRLQAQVPKFGPLDYLKMDLRNMCKARKWVWRKGRCGPRTLSTSSSQADADKFEKMAGTVSQDGWKAAERPLPPPKEKPQEGFPLHQNVDSSLINDYIVECKRMDGVIKYKGHKVLCLSNTGAGNDEQGESLENVYGTLQIAKGPGLPVDKFNPGGSVEARWRNEKEKATPSAYPGNVLSFENVDLNGKDLDPYGGTLANGSGKPSTAAGSGMRGGEGPLQLGDDSSRRLPLNGEKARPWRPTPLPPPLSSEGSSPVVPPAAEDCPGEVDQYGWYPPTKPCSTRKTAMVEHMPEDPAGGWTSGVNGANGDSATFYYNHYTGRIAWKGPAKLPYKCTEEDNGAGTVPNCDWTSHVDLATGEEYWKNKITGKRTWQNPFEEPPQKPNLKPTTRKGTWSGTPGGNTYWTPQFAMAKLGASAKVFKAGASGRGNCGGESGQCLGDELEGLSLSLSLFLFLSLSISIYECISLSLSLSLSLCMGTHRPSHSSTLNPEP